jgi:dsDNA-binding SOS-regulon protein
VWARSRGSGGEVAAVLEEWASHRCVPEGNQTRESLSIFLAR